MRGAGSVEATPTVAREASTDDVTTRWVGLSETSPSTLGEDTKGRGLQEHDLVVSTSVVVAEGRTSRLANSDSAVCMAASMASWESDIYHQSEGRLPLAPGCKEL